MVLWVSGWDTVHDLEAHVLCQGPAVALTNEAHLHGAAECLRPSISQNLGSTILVHHRGTIASGVPRVRLPELPSSSLQLHASCQQRASFCPSQMWYHDLWQSFFNAQIFPFWASRSPLRLTLVSYYRHDSRNLWWLILSDIGRRPRFISCLRQIYWFEFSREQSIGDRYIHIYTGRNLLSGIDSSSTEGEKSNICSQQAGDPGEPMV